MNGAFLRHHNASSFTFSGKILKIVLLINTSRDFSVFRDRTLCVDIVNRLIFKSYLDTFKLKDQYLIQIFKTRKILRNPKIAEFFVNLFRLKGELLFGKFLKLYLKYHWIFCLDYCETFVWNIAKLLFEISRNFCLKYCETYVCKIVKLQQLYCRKKIIKIEFEKLKYKKFK